MKKRIQYNWKFKESESPQFLEWFENQENISSSLRSMLYHMIEQYGTGDFLEPNIQREIVKDSLKLEVLREKEFSNIILGNVEFFDFERKQNVSKETSNESCKVETKKREEEDSKESEKVSKKEAKNQEKTSIKNTSDKEDSYISEVDITAL